MLTSNVSRNDELVYYNFNFANTTASSIPIDVIDTRSTPIIDNPNDYVGAVERFQVSLSTVPIFYWPTLANGTADNTKYFITVEDSLGNISSHPVIFTYESNESAPTVYSFQHFADMINTAIFACCADLAIARRPYIIYNSSEGRYDIIFPTNTFYNSAAPYAKLYMNSLLYRFFNNFQSYHNGALTGRQFLILAKPNGNNDIILTTPPTGAGVAGTGLSVIGEYKNLGQLYSIRRVIFTSDLPLKTEFTPLNTTNTNQITSNSSVPILTDFELNLEGGEAQTVRSIQAYFNQGEYRLFNLNGNTPIKRINVQAYWADNRGVLRPILLSENNYFSMKILFRKKTFKSLL